MTVPVVRRSVGDAVIAAAPQKRLQFLFEHRLNRSADMLSQEILDRIIARFVGQ